MKDNIERIWLIAACICAFFVVLLLFPGIFTHPGSLAPGIGGDAGKNLFSLLYHQQHGDGFWFRGMNYPYGEHITYVDGQPLLSLGHGIFKHFTMAQALATMWLLIGLSYVLAIVFIFKTLRIYAVHPILSIIGASLIIVINPQLYRTLGHFGLSYVCVIPMVFYWTVQYHKKQLIIYPIYIFLLTLIVVLLHPYLSAIILIWCTLYALGCLVYNNIGIRVQRIRAAILLPLAALAATMIFNILIHFTDNISDRPQTPYGLTAYCTRGDHIFTSHYSPIWRFLEDNTTVVKNTAEQEGFCYLGLTAIIVLLSSFCIGASRKIRKLPYTESSEAGFEPIWFFIAFLALVFSMGVPFVWNMDWLVTYLPLVRPFRTLGRFSWLFYFVLTTYSVVTLSKWINAYYKSGNVAKAFVLAGSALLLWGFEASGYITTERNAIERSKGNFATIMGKEPDNWIDFLRSHNFKGADFQATLLLRYFNVGTDKLWLGRDYTDPEMGVMLQTGIQLGLPTINHMAARTSWGVAKKQVKIAGGPYVPKPMLKELPSNKPFLLLNHESDELDPDQKYLLDGATFIGKHKEWIVYACYPSKLIANDSLHQQEVLNLAGSIKNGDSCTKNAGPYYINHFDQQIAKQTFFGKGAMSEIEQHEATIATIPIKPLTDNQLYEFSCWFLLGTENYRSPYFKLDMIDGNGAILKTQDVLTKESVDNSGMWFRAYLYFTMPINTQTIKIRLFNDPEKAYQIMDELMLRPADALIISVSNSKSILVNNHLLNH